MSIKPTLLLAAALAALLGSLPIQAAEGDTSAAQATEQQGAPDKAVKKQAKARSVKLHDHASFHKSGVDTGPGARPEQASDAPRAPAHEHQKFHK